VSLSFPPSEWLFTISIGIAIAAFALATYTKPNRVNADTQGIDTRDCSREFWITSNKVHMISLEERKTEHVEILYSRYRGFGKNHRLNREDFGGIFSYFIGLVKDSGQAFADTYDFYALQNTLDKTVNKSHIAISRKLKNGIKREILGNQLWKHRNRIRNSIVVTIIFLIFAGCLFFLESDSTILQIRDTAIFLGFIATIILLILTVWICIAIDPFEEVGS